MIVMEMTQLDHTVSKTIYRLHVAKVEHEWLYQSWKNIAVSIETPMIQITELQ